MAKSQCGTTHKILCLACNRCLDAVGDGTVCPSCGSTNVGQREQAHDPVHEPEHYRIGNIECKDVIRHFTWPVGNAIKYLWRAGRKHGVTELQDLKKALESIRIRIGTIAPEDPDAR